MKIAVCMKQVPATTEGSMDKETGVLIRAGLESVVNVYDLAALEAALQLQEQTGAQIDVFTMGPQKAESLLKEAYAMGADEGYLICDSAFAGADVLSTSYTLMQAIQSVGTYDIVICGKQTTDGDTAQISGALAHWLELPYISWVNKLTSISETTLQVEYCMEQSKVTANIALPCLLSIERESFIPRMPTLKRKIAARKKEFPTISLSQLQDTNKNHYGLYGSATKVEKIFPPERTAKRTVVHIPATEAANYILQIVQQHKVGEQS